jgi:hypothetical protein
MGSWQQWSSAREARSSRRSGALSCPSKPSGLARGVCSVAPSTTGGSSSTESTPPRSPTSSAPRRHGIPRAASLEEALRGCAGPPCCLPTSLDLPAPHQGRGPSFPTKEPVSPSGGMVAIAGRRGRKRQRPHGAADVDHDRGCALLEQRGARDEHPSRAGDVDGGHLFSMPLSCLDATVLPRCHWPASRRRGVQADLSCRHRDLTTCRGPRRSRSRCRSCRWCR